jgi:hypothetical protein
MVYLWVYKILMYLVVNPRPFGCNALTSGSLICGQRGDGCLGTRLEWVRQLDVDPATATRIIAGDRRRLELGQYGLHTTKALPDEGCCPNCDGWALAADSAGCVAGRVGYVGYRDRPDVDLLCDLNGIVHFDAKVTNRVLDPGVTDSRSTDQPASIMLPLNLRHGSVENGRTRAKPSRRSSGACDADGSSYP